MYFTFSAKNDPCQFSNVQLDDAWGAAACDGLRADRQACVPGVAGQGLPL